MRLLQRYILWELVRTFCFILSVLTVLLVFVGIFQEMTSRGLGFAQVLKILPYIVPSLLPFTIPATLLLTICVVYGRISGDLEITASKAAGINTMSLIWPALGVAGVLSLGSYLLMDRVIPWASGNIQRTIAAAVEDIFLDVLRTQHQMTNAVHGFSITVLDVEGKTLKMPTFQYAPKGKQPLIIQAQEATLKFDLDQHKIILHLVRGHLELPGKSRAWFEEFEKSFPLPNAIETPKARQMSIVKVRKQQAKTRQTRLKNQQEQAIEVALMLSQGNFERFQDPDFLSYRTQIVKAERNANRYHTEIYNRMTMAMSCFFFALVGAPFAILQGKKQFLSSFFMCFLPILLIYYPATLLMLNLSKSGDINPAYAMWLGNALLLIAGLILLRKVLRN